MIRWMQKRRAVVLACLVALVFTVARTGGRPVSAQKAGAAVQAPRFEVDPLWPKPLPNHWVLGSLGGITVDEQDHVWILNRGSRTLADNFKQLEMNPPWAMCCGSAPAVLEFDQAGNLLRHWGGNPGGPGYEWFDQEHGLTIDFKGNVWIGGGRFKRFWGAYGNKPDDSVFENASVTGDQKATGYDPQAPPGRQWRHAVHCVMVSKDDFVYVCDRQGDRVQVFTKEGKFVKEAWIAKETRNAGSVWDIAFSADPQQTYLYVGDGENELIHILRRDTLEELTAFGDGGRQPGQFYGVHVIASDSRGNLYTAETYEGHRVQRFVYKGLAPVTKKYQGVLWPASK